MNSNKLWTIIAVILVALMITTICIDIHHNNQIEGKPVLVTLPDGRNMVTYKNHEHAVFHGSEIVKNKNGVIENNILYYKP